MLNGSLPWVLSKIITFTIVSIVLSPVNEILNINWNHIIIALLRLSTTVTLLFLIFCLSLYEHCVLENLLNSPVHNTSRYTQINS